MAINQISNQALGNFLQIFFSDGVRNQISEDYRDWELVQRQRAGDPDGRSQRFYFQQGYGPSAIQWSGISPAGSFPSAQKGLYSEKEAFYKEIDATIELEYNLWNRARKSPHKYAEPLAMEIQGKSLSSKRRLSADLYGDGTGVLGTVLSSAISSGRVVFTLNTSNTTRGHVGWFEFQENLKAKTQAGAAATSPTVSSGTFDHWQVEDKSRENDTVTLSARDSSDTELTVTVVGVAATNVFYKQGQPTTPDLTAIGSSDYNTLAEPWAGLESLAAADGRVVHGITMSGATGGSRFDAGGDPLDVSHIQRSMSQCKTAVGEGRYSYKGMLMAPEANDVLIESRETDRRFITIDDNKRGLKKFAYVHGNDTIEVMSSEFCPKKRIYMLPEAKNGQKVLEFWGSDFESVKPAGQGSEFFLKPSSSGGHERVIRSYLEAVCVLIAKHPKAINSITNFVLS